MAARRRFLLGDSAGAALATVVLASALAVFGGGELVACGRFLSPSSQPSAAVESRSSSQPAPPRGQRRTKPTGSRDGDPGRAVPVPNLETVVGFGSASILQRSARKAAVDEGPQFLDYLDNQTIPAGREVKLACRVRNLGDHKVAWIRNDPSAILAVNNHVITRNNRISVSHDGHLTWYLKISDIRESDGGMYLCQINTEKPMTRSSHISVVVPPDIIDSESSSDVIVREKSDVMLRCKARGSPTPRVYWERIDPNRDISINETYSVTRFEGETLELFRVSRSDMGDYRCFASNGVHPSRTKRIRLNVDFPPLLFIQQQRLGAPLGATVVLECTTEAHPDSLNFWTTADGNMIYTERDDKFKSEVVIQSPTFKKHMKLTIFNLEPADFGGYKCVAKNPIGEIEGLITIEEKKPPKTDPPSTTISYQYEEIDVKEYWAAEDITSNEIPSNAAGAAESDDMRLENISKPPKKRKGRRRNEVSMRSKSQAMPLASDIAESHAVRILWVLLCCSPLWKAILSRAT